MKKIIKLITNFPLTFYSFLFLLSLFAFIVADPITDDGVGWFWGFLLKIFLPMVALGINGYIFSTIIFFLLLDLFLLYLRKCLIPAIRQRNRKLLVPNLPIFPRLAKFLRQLIPSSVAKFLKKNTKS